jgi:Fe2+ transport system protein B
MGKPMVVALNMIDEARANGVAVDTDLLSDLLGVPVIETVAVRNQGIDELKERWTSARTGHSDPELDSGLVEMASRVGCRSEALLVLEADEPSPSGTASSRRTARAGMPSTCAVATGSTTSSGTSCATPPRARTSPRASRRR